MNKNIAIRAVDISKQYRLGEVGTGTLSHDLNRFWAKLRGKEDPFLKIGESNDRSTKGSSDYVWSLKDINFEIEKGDAVGIIGRNGAGKSTLLKLLSRVTKPTTGHFEVNGRIASLLEVGTGFNPEMTGRENIFLNGAILGMRRNEIKRKFDEIVDFAGVERYIDTPVKRYSSGMYVRLAFAVAAHLESEILIVDEVLAVGDAEFQKKCLGKMGDVSKGEGRTVLFVSHNIGAVKNLCGKGIYLENGFLKKYSDIDTVIDSYLLQEKGSERTYFGKNVIKKAEILSEDSGLNFKGKFAVKIYFSSQIPIKNIILGIVIKDKYDVEIVGINNRHYHQENLNEKDIKEGEILLKIDELSLLPGNYKLDIFLGDSSKDIEIITDALRFTVNDNYKNKILNKIDFRINKVFHENIKWQLTT